MRRRLGDGQGEPDDAEVLVSRGWRAVDGPLGAYIIVPPGALTADTKLSIALADDSTYQAQPDAAIPRGAVFAFTPHGQSSWSRRRSASRRARRADELAVVLRAADRRRAVDARTEREFRRRGLRDLQHVAALALHRGRYRRRWRSTRFSRRAGVLSGSARPEVGRDARARPSRCPGTPARSISPARTSPASQRRKPRRRSAAASRAARSTATTPRPLRGDRTATSRSRSTRRRRRRASRW